MVVILFILAEMFLQTHQVAGQNCLREHSGILDADFSLINRFENQWTVDEEDVANHVALISTRFKRGHEFQALNSVSMKRIAKGISKHTRRTNTSFQLFFCPRIEDINMDMQTTISLYQNISKAIDEVNSGVVVPIAGLYAGAQAITYDNFLQVLELVFGPKENSTFPIGHGSKNCLIDLRTRSALKYLQRLNFLTCFVHPLKKSSPELSADEVIQNCGNLRDTAVAMNITAEIMCRVRYPSFGISPEGVVGSVFDFHRFWCKIVSEVTRNKSHPQIIMSSSFDEPNEDYKGKGVNLQDSSYHYGWWKRRDTTSYEPSAFQEKVEELEFVNGSCSRICVKCSSHADCCEGTTCEDDSSFQPFESEPSLQVCKATLTNCAPRIPLETPIKVFPANQTPTDSLPTRLEESNLNTVNFSVIILVLLFLVVIISLGVQIYRKRKSHAVLTRDEVRYFFDGSTSSNVRNMDESGLNLDGLPYERKLEVIRHTYEIYEDQLLGSGAFGVVMKGRLGNVDVAVKTTLPGVEKVYLKSLILELKILSYLGEHENIVNLLGVDSTKLFSGNLYLFMELCPLGNLLQFLRKCRKEFAHNKFSTEQIDEIDDSQLTCKHLLLWSIQITNAMAHLADKKVVHADIAARNILVFSREVVKLTDFGLSRRLYEYANYTKKSQEPLPWRHMSIETLCDSNFSTKSDVWSFGVTLWEMFTLGKVPYPGYSLSQDFVELLLNGLRLDCPAQTHPLIYEVMQSCWTTDADLRPSISVIHFELSKALDEIYTNRLYVLPSEIQ